MSGANNSVNPLTEFQWTPQPKAEHLIHEIVGGFLERSEFARELRDRFYQTAAVRLVDLIDHIRLPKGTGWEAKLAAADYQQRPESAFAADLFVQDQGIFPPVLLTSHSKSNVLAVKVASVADFEAVWQTGAVVHGAPLAPVRSAAVWSRATDEIWIVERHGNRGFDESLPPPSPTKLFFHDDTLRRRPRSIEEDAGFAAAAHAIERAIDDLGVDYACDRFFSIERDYWQCRNRAGQAQRMRQDRVGIGWANHDHHTYRSSRKYFSRMIGIFEKLGFHCRERFYAGREAGWGAQVLEQPNTGIVIFADVDLAPDELIADFAHEPLPERKELGTVGLWCALHGESFLQAGMHHLECQFDFEALKNQLATEAGVQVMKPFTDFPHLRQAFTAGERWPVATRRIDALLKAGKISAEQAAGFECDGAIGSHLENLERNAGFKGFNQTGVSEIISATDPRNYLPTQ